MDSEICDILTYCKGFDDTYDYPLLAQEFYDLGEMIRGLDEETVPIYEDMLSLVYLTIDHASKIDNVHKVVLGKAHPEISPFGVLPSQSNSCANYSAFALNSLGKAFLSNPFRIESTARFNPGHFYNFFKGVADKTLSAYWAPYPIDSQSLYHFLWYAFQMGRGMDARTASISRLQENQIYHPLQN